MRLREKETLTEHANGGRGLNALIPFGDLDDVVAATEFLSDTPDQAARAFSQAYRAILPADKREDPANRSARPWDDLDETFRQATRDAVGFTSRQRWPAPGSIRRCGRASPGRRICRRIPAAAAPVTLEPLAELEHNRWNAQRRMDGWRWADVPRKDEQRRIHPDLVEYDQLADGVKEYDRAIVRETQLICWNAPA